MRYRSAAAAVVGTVVLTTAGVATAGAPASPSPRLPAQEGGGEYVVAFEAGDEAAALAAIEASGGVVVDVQEQVGLALVETSAPEFASAITADASVTGVAQNQSIGASRPGQAPVRATERLTVMERGAASASRPSATARRRSAEELEHLQWDMAMIGATLDGAHRRATGKRVTVGIIDTGVDASHPDIAPNFSWELSRNFTHDIPAIDGACDEPTCIDPAWVDEGGHGTHVAGTVGAARNEIGITGVAPEATIVNVRAGQDSGYFFFYETVSALLYAADAGLDIVNMSFYTDPWLYNCDSLDDYVSGAVTPAQLEEQAMIRTAVIAALEYAHLHGVTLIAAAGNGHTDLALPQRPDATSPDYPPGSEVPRVVTSDCLDLPSEGPHVLQVSAVGPTGAKADYSNYGFGDIDVSAPGGWFRDGIGTPTYRTNANQILSSYPWDLAIEEGLINAAGVPQLPDVYAGCDDDGNCGVWSYLQGTSMASPHVAGEAALIVDAHGRKRRNDKSLDPDVVTQIIKATATDHACPVGGVEVYTDEGRPADWNAACAGSTANNGIYGEGVINATAAVARPTPA